MLNEDTIQLIKDVNKATFEAFIQTGQYALSLRGAYKQFGKTTIEYLITNGYLKKPKVIRGGKCRFLLSDIIVALQLKNMKSDKKSRI